MFDSQDSPSDMRFGAKTSFCQIDDIKPIILILTLNTYNNRRHIRCSTFDHNNLKYITLLGHLVFVIFMFFFLTRTIRVFLLMKIHSRVDISLSGPNHGFNTGA